MHLLCIDLFNKMAYQIHSLKHFSADLPYRYLFNISIRLYAAWSEHSKMQYNIRLIRTYSDRYDGYIIA